MQRLLLLAALALPLSTDSSAYTQPPRPLDFECVQSRSEVRPNHPGYNHVVVLTNRCDATFRCVVTTDVSSEAITADVPARNEIEVLTFRNSPASTFTYEATCNPKE